MEARIYHHATCSKSNAALNLLLEQGLNIDVINYIESPLSREELLGLLELLNIEANKLLRFGEPLAKELGIAADDIRVDDEWLSFMVRHPILIERPIIVIGNKAIIGRPPEVVLDIIQGHQ